MENGKWKKVLRVPGRLGSSLAALAVFATISIISASSASAQQLTTSVNLRAAANLAVDQGICTARDTKVSSDCTERTYTCDGGSVKWETFVADHVEFRGATVSHIPDKDVSIPQEVVSFLNANPDNQKRIPTFTVGNCFCLCGGPTDTDQPCGGIAAGTPLPVSTSMMTKEECTAVCGKRSVAPKCAGALQPAEYGGTATAGQSSNVSAAKASALQMNCFSKEDCGKQGGVWESFTECRDGKGRCFASVPAITLNIPIGKVTQIQGFNDYIVTVYSYLLSILVVATTVMFIYGAFRYLVGSSPLGGIQRGKQIMIDAVIGMFLVLAATMILRTINPALTNLNPLKVYMINTVQSISAIYCSDVASGLKLADAGPSTNVALRDDVEKVKGAYSVSPDATTCGHSYYIEGTTGNACTGTVCKEKGTACVSCVGGYSECKGSRGPEKVCAHLEFGGNIQYDNGRSPKRVVLVLACGSAKNPQNLSVIQQNLDLSEVGNISNGPNAGSATPDKTGVASYHIDVNDGTVLNWSNGCSNGSKGTGNNFLGAFLGVEYNGGTAVIAPAKCIGGGGKLSGYANGSDIAKAFQCGMNPPNTDFENPGTGFWSLDNLKSAASGNAPIVCNFNLDDSSAPDSPADKPGFCTTPGTGGSANGTAACPSGTASGSSCAVNNQKCTLPGGKICSCWVLSSPTGGPSSGSWTCK